MLRESSGIVYSFFNNSQLFRWIFTRTAHISSSINRQYPESYEHIILENTLSAPFPQKGNKPSSSIWYTLYRFLSSTVPDPWSLGKPLIWASPQESLRDLLSAGYNYEKKNSPAFMASVCYPAISLSWR